MSALFQSLNRNKQSVVVDLRSAEEVRRLKALIQERADVVIQNLRPGTAADFGLDADALRKAKPALICCTIGAFGKAGPLKDRPGYDPLMQAFGGIMSVTGEPGRPPVRVGVSVIDMGAGMWSVIAILSALMTRAASGVGASIDTSLYEVALGWMTYHAATTQASGVPPVPQGSGAPQIVPYRGFATTDGFIIIAAGNDKLFARLSGALGHPEWGDDPRFRGNPQRVAQRDLLNGLIEEIVRTKSSAEWQAILDEAGVPCAPMQSMDQVLAHPQTAALGMLQQSADGKFNLMGLPISFDGVRPALRSSAPELGADTEAVLDPYSTAPRKVSRS
jgi:crotonobetainyl-CoA:carnitine CoA-transferase CaiB-like acyl-CoA transferase